MKHSHKSPFPKRNVPLSGRKSKKPQRGSKPSESETSLETFVRKMDQLSKLPNPTSGPKLFKEGPGGTLEQVGREADNAWAGVKKIMSLLNVESKVLDYQVQFTSTWTGNLLNCSSIAQGIADNQRTGDSLRVQRFRVRAMINWATANTIVTIMIGRSKDGLPLIGDVIESAGSGYSAVTFENHDQRKVDQILSMKHVVIDSVSHPTQYVDFSIKCPDLPTTYVNGSANTSANTYWAAAICGVASGPVINFNSRIDFVDN